MALEGGGKRLRSVVASALNTCLRQKSVGQTGTSIPNCNTFRLELMPELSDRIRILISRRKFEPTLAKSLDVVLLD